MFLITSHRFICINEVLIYYYYYLEVINICIDNYMYKNYYRFLLKFFYVKISKRKEK